MISLLGFTAIWGETKVMQYRLLFRQTCREPEGINNIRKDQVPILLPDSLRDTVRYALITEIAGRTFISPRDVSGD